MEKKAKSKDKKKSRKATEEIGENFNENMDEGRDTHLLSIAIISNLVSLKFSANFEKELKDSLLATVAGGKNKTTKKTNVTHEYNRTINVNYWIL